MGKNWGNFIHSIYNTTKVSECFLKQLYHSFIKMDLRLNNTLSLYLKDFLIHKLKTKQEEESFKRKQT